MTMKLEPEVIERIAAEKRRVLLQKITVIACLVPGFLLFLGLILAVVFSRQINIDPDRITIIESLTVGAVVLALFGTIVQCLQMRLAFNNFLRGQVGHPIQEFSAYSPDKAVKMLRDALSRVLPLGNSKEMLSSPTEQVDVSQLSFEKFINGIEAAGIAVGLKTPHIVVLDIPEMSSVSFQSYDKQPTVGVTRAALDTDLSDQEAEALMAHEMSHLIIGDILRPPRYFSITSLFIASPVLSAFVLIASALGGNSDIVALFLVSLLIFIWYPLAYYLFRRRYGLLDRHKDVLADSISCKITSNPQALLTAIDKLVERDLLGRIPIGQGILTLAFPTSEYHARPSNCQQTDSLSLITELIVVPTRKEKDAIEERRRNLLEIQKGHWQAFETVCHGRVKEAADLWE